ncbi:MAG: NUMOD4 domain-containing protein [Agriterribacter sp.]
MIKKVPGESWKPLHFSGWKELRKKYAVSSHGRVASYTNNIHEDGQLLSGSLTTGYRSLNLHRPGNKGTLYIHREIARLFCKKPSPKHQFVIHVNYNKTDNKSSNLKWATLSEVSRHQQKSPAKIAYKKVQANRSSGLKLSTNQVSAIKKTIADPNRKLTYKQLAEKYDVSEMTLYRIKSGENWARVK